MSKKANPVAIGTFVVVALVLAVGAILTLGSGKLFKKTEQFVLYFEGSLSGLDIGAPVELGGIRIGQVSNILLVYDTDDGTITAPVYIEIEQDRMKYAGSKSEGKGMDYHIETGLRAQLQSQSFITGKLKISLVKQPKTPIRLVSSDPEIKEIPTVPTLMESLSKSFEDLPFVEIVADLKKITGSFSKLSETGELTELVTYLKETAQSLSEISGSDQIPKILVELQETGESISSLAESPQLMDALREFTATVQSARYLFDYLERHPEALLRGKGGE